MRVVNTFAFLVVDEFAAWLVNASLSWAFDAVIPSSCSNARCLAVCSSWPKITSPFPDNGYNLRQLAR
jgi:hypothetical protein